MAVWLPVLKKKFTLYKVVGEKENPARLAVNIRCSDSTVPTF